MSSSKRRLARIAASDSDSEDEEREPRAPAAERKLKLAEEDEDDEVEERQQSGNEDDDDDDHDREETPTDEAKPIGEPIKVSGKGRSKRSHFKAFEFDGNHFELEDPVLLTPEDSGQKPYVAIIKEITQDVEGSIMVTGQWFYRPEEAEKKGGGSWEPRDTRELFYSFHQDEVPAESVMHKCVAHFVPLQKKLPERSEHPGFIVQKVYDTVERKLWKLTDKDYEDENQHEIDLLVQKTRERLGAFVDVEASEVIPMNITEAEDATADPKDQLKNKRRKSMLSLDVSREDDANNRSDHHLTADTPGSCGEASEFFKILANFKSLSGDTPRDKWLEKVLQVVQSVFDTNGELQDAVNQSNTTAASEARNQKDIGPIRWPDAAVQAVVAVEKATHDAFSTEFQKYNQKMRSLWFNLKTNTVLSRRLVTGELEPSVIPFMSPNELKDGLTAKETATKEPDESERMQMTDARCSRCSERKVGLTDIIQAGGRGDRYQLECIACGHTWYAFRDDVSALTIDAPSAAGNVGTTPLATAKFEDVEKLGSPRESEKPDVVDVLKKTTVAYIPVLENQMSSQSLRAEEPYTLNNKE